jgi:hypothetical protein
VAEVRFRPLNGKSVLDSTFSGLGKQFLREFVELIR